MKKTNPLPSKERLDRLLKYEKTTGRLFWRKRSPDLFTATAGRNQVHACNQWNSRWAGKEAFVKVNKGYRCGVLNYQPVLAHRVIWKMMTDKEPIEVDHIDGDRLNNRWRNLRNVTIAQNRRNAAKRSDNKSGTNGVFWNSRYQNWQVVIHVGGFDKLEDAIAARKQAERRLGYHPNHGREAKIQGSFT